MALADRDGNARRRALDLENAMACETVRAVTTALRRGFEQPRVAPRVLLVGGSLELLTTLRSVLGAVDVYVDAVDPAIDDGGVERSLELASVIVVAEEEAAVTVRPDQSLLRIACGSKTVRPSALAVEAWFSTPPRADEIVDFVRRFFAA
jgi:hypothetical protein